MRGIWGLFLSKQENALFDRSISLMQRNIPFFLGCNLIGCIVCTLIYSNVLPLWLHLSFFLCVFSSSILCFWRNRRTTLAIPTEKSRLTALRRTVWHFALFGLLWDVYFTFALQYPNILLIQQLVIVLTMVSSMGITLVGRFTRVYTLTLSAVVGHMVFMLLSFKIDEYRVLSIQLLLSALAQLFLLRTLNEQFANTLNAKDENSHLVEALQTKNDALMQANTSQSRYLSAASHDLRQPLHALALLTNDAQRKNTSPEIDVTLNKMEQAIDSLSESFNAMLNLSRLDAGVVKPQFTNFPIALLFKRLSIEFSSTAANKNLNLRFFHSDLWVYSDEGMLYSILSNFVSNAIRYTDKGGVLVGVRADGQHTAKVLIYDTGVGVPAEKAKQIFQEYLRLESAEQRAKGGVGLGLAISERMARLIGTKLLVKSIPNKGSSFGLVIPRVESSEQTVSAPSMQDTLQGKRVAIVDDDETALESLEDLLTSWGMDVSIALSSAMLGELMDEEGHFDLVISDYHLGASNETGMEILKHAKMMQTPPPCCFLLTGDTRTELTNEVKNAGINIWYKPLRPVRFRAYLNSLFNNTTNTN